MSTTADSLTGVGSLTRFGLRRDRVRIAVWIAAIVLLVLSTVGSIKGLYPNQLELDKAARTSEDNAAAIIFNGPPQNLDTVGGQFAFQTGISDRAVLVKGVLAGGEGVFRPEAGSRGWDGGNPGATR